MSKFEYTNDALGRRTSVTVSGTAFTAAGTTGFDLYTYNDRNELTSARRYAGGTLENPSNPVYTRHFGYDYDPIGNRESYQISQGTATTYTANQLNQYTATADPSESFTHDDDGNLTQDGTYTYVWDAENRLVEIRPTSPGTNAIKFVYDYDYLGRRARRTQYGWTGSAWSTSIADQRIYLYDRWNNLIIYDADNGMAIGRKLTWGLDLSGLNGNPTAAGIHGAGGIGGLVAAWAPGSPAKQYFCFYDANGNLSDCLKNSDGTRWSHFEYDPYGGPIVASDAGGLSHQFRYSTKFYQAAFGNYDFGRRYLHPKLGRWFSRDPIAERGGSNLQAFVLNQPTQRIDPQGRCASRPSHGDSGCTSGMCLPPKSPPSVPKTPGSPYDLGEPVVDLEIVYCEKQLDEAMGDPRVVAILAFITNSLCCPMPPRPRCQLPPAPDLFGRWPCAYVDADGTIVFYEPPPPGGCGSIVDTLMHELVHYMDRCPRCTPEIQWVYLADTCAGHVEAEFRAYLWGTCENEPDRCKCALAQVLRRPAHPCCTEDEYVEEVRQIHEAYCMPPQPQPPPPWW